MRLENVSTVFTDLICINPIKQVSGSIRFHVRMLLESCPDDPVYLVFGKKTNNITKLLA